MPLQELTITSAEEAFEKLFKKAFKGNETWKHVNVFVNTAITASSVVELIPVVGTIGTYVRLGLENIGKPPILRKTQKYAYAQLLQSAFLLLCNCFRLEVRLVFRECFPREKKRLVKRELIGALYTFSNFCSKKGIETVFNDSEVGQWLKDLCSIYCGADLDDNSDYLLLAKISSSRLLLVSEFVKLN